MERDELRRVLMEIDRTSESVAVRAAEDPEVQALAFALHRLVVCVAQLANQVHRGASGPSGSTGFVGRQALPSAPAGREAP